MQSKPVCIWSLESVTDFNLPYSTFCQLIAFKTQVYVVTTNQLLQEGSETSDLLNYVTVVTLRPTDIV